VRVGEGMNIFAIAVTAELLLFLFCGIALGLLALSYRVMLIVAAGAVIKGLVWDAHFLRGVYLHSIVITSLSVAYLMLGWALYFEKGVKRTGRVIG